VSDAEVTLIQKPFSLATLAGKLQAVLAAKAASSQ
jgi:hypothetical protein